MIDQARLAALVSESTQTCTLQTTTDWRKQWEATCAKLTAAEARVAALEADLWRALAALARPEAQDG